jgi:hypothetical protein
MKSVRRYDRGELVPAHLTDEGYLFFEGYATRAGVFPYKRADGSIQMELRPAEEVGNPDSLASLARKPVTDLHPKEFVDAGNIEIHGVGQLDAEVVWEKDFADGFVRVRGTVQRKDAVAAIDKGRRELSCGYTADVDMTPGEWKDSTGIVHKYDGIQRNIRYNHLALVDRGRAGRLAKLRVDSDDAIMDEDLTNPDGDDAGHKETTMKIKIDGKEFDIAEVGAIQRAIVEFETRHADAVISLRESTANTAELTAKMDTMITLEDVQGLKAELDVLKTDAAKRNDHDDTADRLAWANERFALVELARQTKIDGFEDLAKVEGDNDAIKRKIVLSRFDEEDLPSQAHVDAAFALMKKGNGSSTKSLADAIVGGQGREEKRDAIMDAQAKYEAGLRGETAPN